MAASASNSQSSKRRCRESSVGKDPVEAAAADKRRAFRGGSLGAPAADRRTGLLPAKCARPFSRARSAKVWHYRLGTQ